MIAYIRFAYLLTATAIVAAFAVPDNARAVAPNPVKVGMVKSLFRDVPTPLARIFIRPFGSLMKEFTGLNGQMHIGDEAIKLTNDLKKGKYHLAVYTGVEFAWAQKHDANLQPIMVAISDNPDLRAVLLVRKNSEIESFQRLQGKKIALPTRSKIHCHLFLDKGCADCGRGNVNEFFAAVDRAWDPESAIDQVVLGKLDGVIVDTNDIKAYKLVKSAWFATLRIADRSPQFPPGVVACYKGRLNEATVKRFRQGMLRANTSPRGQRSMQLFKISAFQSVPANYAQALRSIMKEYPAPDAPSMATAVTIGVMP